MKNILLTSILLFTIHWTYAQMGINAPNPKAQFEIRASNQATPTPIDGLLIPKIDAFPATNPSADQDGMLVYLTTTVGQNTKGFYNWDNASQTWKAITTPSLVNNSWNLTGNTGTNPATHFIGTTDDLDLIIKRNNILSGRITNSNVSLGYISAFAQLPSASYNVSVGLSAMRFNTTGTENTAVGANALLFNTLSFKNTGIGFQALYNNTGANNTAVGHSALSVSTTANNNTALGYQSGNNITTGSNNITIGNNTSVLNPNGNNQLNLGTIIFGTDVNSAYYGKIGIGLPSPTEKLDVAGKTKTIDLQITNGAAAGNILLSDAVGNATWTSPSALPNNNWTLNGNTGTNPATHFIGTIDDVDLVIKRNNILAGIISIPNLSVGVAALLNNTSGTNNSAFGNYALNANTSGNNNIAFGNYALNANTTGFANIGIGYNALNKNTTGSTNIAQGFNALLNNTTGSRNLAIGVYALSANTTGYSNYGIGYNTLNNNTIGNFNIAIGNNALFNNSTGSSNLAIGANALTSNTTAINNVAYGNIALASNTTGSNNVATGLGALSYSNGSYNVANGIYALYNNSSGNENTALGYYALNNNAGNYNTAIGSGALSVNAGSGNVGIGNNAQVANSNGSNQLSISNFVYGQDLNDLATGKIGIGVQVPSERLEVAGKTKTTDLQITNNAAAGKVLISDSTGNAVWSAQSFLNNWGLTGNAGTNAATNFIGTNDDVDLVIKRNNTLAGKITNSNLSLGVVALLNNTSGSLNTALGNYALNANTTGLANQGIGYNALNKNTTGNYNIAQGYNALFSNTTGSNNTATGAFALSSNTTADNNIAYGNYALTSNITGLQNTAVGYFSMKQNVSGNNNAAYGAYSLNNNTTGGLNTALGNYTLLNNTIGTRNTALSNNALIANVGGTDNVAIGYQAAQANINGSRITAIGTEAMFNNTASDMTAVGYRALLNNTTGAQNTAVGASALRENTTGGNNIAMGQETMISNTTGSNNTALGPFALRFNATGQKNIAVGSLALYNNTGSSNTAIGDNAMLQNTSGINNVAVGSSALLNATTASGNVAIGQYAMATNTVTGEYNTALGTAALTRNTTGGGNVAVGTNALNVNTTGGGNIALGLALGANTSGNYNMAIGERALNANTTGSTNVALGKWSMETLATGSDNTSVGHRAGQLLTGAATNNLSLGFNAQVPSNTGSNQVSIANVIYATGTGTSGAGNVGIGTGTPATKLDVAGTTKTTNFQMTSGGGNNLILRSDANGNGNWQSISSLEADPKIGGQVTNQIPKWNGNQFVNGAITDNGYVGINATNPQAQLHVSGNSYATSPSQQRGYFSANTGANTVPQDVNASGNILIRADGWIWSNGGGFVATSDARIKNIKGITNTQKDLEALSKIEITDYKYKDEVANGSTPQKKVIAQQLQTVYPIAVNKSTGVIPSVFELAKTVVVKENKTEIITNTPHNFATGDEVKLILNKSGEKTYKVTVQSPNIFSIEDAIAETVFVYGKKVTDLLNVDYDALTTLNISATQELIKRVQSLEKENSTLKLQNEQNNNLLKALISDVQSLKSQKEVSIMK